MLATPMRKHDDVAQCIEHDNEQKTHQHIQASGSDSHTAHNLQRQVKINITLRARYTEATA